MTPDVILSRFQSGLDAGTFSMADVHRCTGIPQSSLQGMRDGPGAQRVAERLAKIGAALPRLEKKALLSATFRQRAAFDPRRPVKAQLADVERDLLTFGVAVAEVCRRVDVTESRWRQWKAGPKEPAYSLWVTVLDAANQLIEDAAREIGAAQTAEAGLA